MLPGDAYIAGADRHVRLAISCILFATLAFNEGAMHAEIAALRCEVAGRPLRTKFLDLAGAVPLELKTSQRRARVGQGVALFGRCSCGERTASRPIPRTSAGYRPPRSKKRGPRSCSTCSSPGLTKRKQRTRDLEKEDAWPPIDGWQAREEKKGSEHDAGEEWSRSNGSQSLHRQRCATVTWPCKAPWSRLWRSLSPRPRGVVAKLTRRGKASA